MSRSPFLIKFLLLCVDFRLVDVVLVVTSGALAHAYHSATDPYLREAGPGTVQRRTRLRMDLSYGSGKTKDECGTEADARAISDR